MEEPQLVSNTSKALSVKHAPLAAPPQISSFNKPKSSVGTNSTEDMTSVDSQVAAPVEKVDESCLDETFAVATTEKLKADKKNVDSCSFSRNSYSPATTEQSLSASSSSTSLFNSSSSSPIESTMQTLSETDKLYKIIDQLKMEKQWLVNSVMKLSEQTDDHQRLYKSKKNRLTSELSAYKSCCQSYEKSRRDLETNIVEILRSEITDDGLPVVHDDLIEKCRVAIEESIQPNPSTLSSWDKDSDNLDIFIDHYNVSVMIEANLADECNEKVISKNPMGTSSGSDLTDASMSPQSSFQTSAGRSHGDNTAAKIAKLPEKFLIDKKRNSNSSLGCEMRSDLIIGNSTSRSKLSPSVRSYGSHVSMDSLRRRSMMETRIKCDNDPYDSDQASVISSISEHGNDHPNKLSPKKNRRTEGSRKNCICGAYRSRRERTTPSSYRYFDEKGNLVMTKNGNSIVSKNTGNGEMVDEVDISNVEMEDEFDDMNLNSMEEDEKTSPEENVEKKTSFTWKWW